MIHIKPWRLFELSQAKPVNRPKQMAPEEQEHLRQCDLCQQILAVLARQFDESRPPHDRDKDSHDV